MVQLPKTSLPKWLIPLVNMKLAMVNGTDRGDVPPVVLAERKGKPVSLIMAGQGNKMLGLHAAKLARIGMDVDTITVMFDAHMAGLREGETVEQFRERYPPGSMQRMCDEEGACELGEIIDCITVQRVTRTDTVGASLPYHYHGVGTTFRWDEEKIAVQSEVLSGEKRLERMSGMLSDALRKIINMPSLLEQGEAILTRMFGDGPDAREKAFYHGARGTMQALDSQGFFVLDFISTGEEVTHDTVADVTRAFGEAMAARRKEKNLVSQ